MLVLKDGMEHYKLVVYRRKEYSGEKRVQENAYEVLEDEKRF